MAFSFAEQDNLTPAVELVASLSGIRQFGLYLVKLWVILNSD